MPPKKKGKAKKGNPAQYQSQEDLLTGTETNPDSLPATDVSQPIEEETAGAHYNPVAEVDVIDETADVAVPAKKKKGKGKKKAKVAVQDESGSKKKKKGSKKVAAPKKEPEPEPEADTVNPQAADEEAQVETKPVCADGEQEIPVEEASKEEIIAGSPEPRPASVSVNENEHGDDLPEKKQEDEIDIPDKDHQEDPGDDPTDVSKETKEDAPTIPQPRRTYDVTAGEGGNMPKVPNPHMVDLEGMGDVDPNDYGIEMEAEPEYQYEPPSQENLPDLATLLNTLDGGESDLEAERDPPDLFRRPEQEPNYKNISSLKLEMEEEPIDPYITQFEDEIRDDVLMIGNISLEEVQEEERRLRDEHILYQQQEAILARKRQENVLLREERSKRHVTKVMKDKRKELARMEELNIQRERLLQDQLHKTFKKSENQLRRALEIRKGEVKTMYGDLMMADGQYGGSKGRRWKVDWNRAPQPVQIKIKCLRGVKDKLPAGRYVLMVSLYDRLGGHTLRWSHLRGQEWGGATLPLMHDGKFHNVEIKVDQSLFTVCPAKPDVRPGMMVMFELFLLRGSLLPVDKVVSWGVFPICDEQFNIIQGKYKTPMLRGEMDPRIDRHAQLEKLLASDIDHWMCNLYFEVIKLPRYLVGQKEYEVELQFTSQLINYPDRTKGAEEAIDGDEPIMGSQPELGSTGGSQTGSHINMSSSQPSLSTGSSQGDDKMASSDSGSFGKPQSSSSGDSMGSRKSVRSSDRESVTKEGDASKVRFRGTDKKRGGGTQPPATVFNSRRLLEKSAKSRLDSDDDSDNSDYEDMRQRQDGFTQIKGEPGLYYKQHINPPATDYMRRLYTMLPKTALLSQKRKRKKLTYLEELDTHSFAVKQPFSNKGHIHGQGQEKVQYVTRQLFSELGLAQWRSREFWTLLILLVLIFFIRVYLHYVGQWIFLNIINIPISKFEFLPYSVNLNYQSSLLHTQEEVCVVILGPLMNIIILSLLVGCCWASQKYLGSFPDLFCKFVIVYGIHTFLDPVLIAIVDAPLGRYDLEVGDDPIADAAKLYFHFERTHGTGLMGILLTVPIYFFLMFFAGVIFYMYFLRLHNNGRMLDIYHRLHAPEDDFFVPYDLEISNQELSYICKKCEQWRGEEGERRKTAVYDYIWQEEDQDDDAYLEEEGDSGTKEGGKTEVTTHVSVHTLHLDGLRELHRHFLRLPDGGIVEVFGEMGVVGMDKDLKAALHQGASGIEGQKSTTNWMVSTESLSRPRPKTVGGIGSQDLLNIPPTPGVNLRAGGRAPSESSLGPSGSLGKAASYSSLGQPRSPKISSRPPSGRPRPQSGVQNLGFAASAENVTEL